MEISFLDLKEKEVVNVFSGQKLGRVIDLVFDTSNGEMLGLVVPGDKKLFRKGDDIFVPLDKLKRIGSDVILVGLQTESGYSSSRQRQQKLENGFSRYENIKNNQVGLRDSQAYAYRDLGQGFQGSNMQNFSNGQSRSTTSYVRLKPLDGKKYK